LIKLLVNKLYLVFSFAHHWLAVRAAVNSHCSVAADVWRSIDLLLPLILFSFSASTAPLHWRAYSWKKRGTSKTKNLSFTITGMSLLLIQTNKTVRQNLVIMTTTTKRV